MSFEAGHHHGAFHVSSAHLLGHRMFNIHIYECWDKQEERSYPDG